MKLDPFLLVFLFILFIIFQLRKRKASLPCLKWSYKKAENLQYIRDRLNKAILPKVYESRLFWLRIGPTIITDYDLLQKIFGSIHVSSRLDNENLYLEEKLTRQDYNLPCVAKNILKADWIEGKYGIGNGPYDKTHRILRKRWSQSSAFKENVCDIIVDNSKKIINTIEQQMELSPEGFEPLDLLMNASMDIVTFFCLGEYYEYKDPEFIKISTMVQGLFQWLMVHVKAKTVALVTPKWLIRQHWYRKLKMKLIPGHKKMCDLLYMEFYPYIFQKIKEHHDTIDVDAPRDFLDLMLIEARNEESGVGYHTIAMTVVGLYLGGSDTVTNSLRWLLLQLTEFPEVQEVCYSEIVASVDHCGNIQADKCNYTNSVLLESTRVHPVADTLPHQATKDVTIDEYSFKCGTTFFGSLYAIMHDPKNFSNPENFVPTRFLHENVFISDKRVCLFSVGKRNCVGKYLAQREYFEYAARMILNYKFERTKGNMQPNESIDSINVPSEFKIKFIKR